MIDYVWNTQKSLRRQPGFSLCQFLRTEHWRMTSLYGKDGVKGSAITATSAGWYHSECLNFPSRTLILVRHFSNSLSSCTPALPFLSSLASSMVSTNITIPRSKLSPPLRSVWPFRVGKAPDVEQEVEWALRLSLYDTMHLTLRLLSTPLWRSTNALHPETLSNAKQAQKGFIIIASEKCLYSKENPKWAMSHLPCLSKPLAFPPLMSTKTIWDDLWLWFVWLC